MLSADDASGSSGDLPCYCYSIGLPLGEGQGDVAALLRHVAASIDDLTAQKSAEIMGLMYSDNEVNEYGGWPRMTVFYTLED